MTESIRSKELFMNNRNYQRELDALITGFEKENKVPRLFLHSCCAPCSSYVLEYLSKYFEITVFFYNPNISPKEMCIRDRYCTRSAFRIYAGIYHVAG